MNPPSDPRRVYPDGTRRSRAITTQRRSRHVHQTQLPASASREISQLPQSLPQMQPPITNNRTYPIQVYQDTSTYQYAQWYVASTVSAHQGSSPQQYDEYIDAHNRLTLPGDNHLSHDVYRRTANFVDSGQYTGTRYAPYADDAEQHGVASAARTITHFERQFSHGTNSNTTIQDVQQRGTTWHYPQRIDPNSRDYLPTVEYTSILSLTSPIFILIALENKVWRPVDGSWCVHQSKWETSRRHFTVVSQLLVAIGQGECAVRAHRDGLLTKRVVWRLFDILDSGYPSWVGFVHYTIGGRVVAILVCVLKIYSLLELRLGMEATKPGKGCTKTVSHQFRQS
ncbi:unnamed protein product [Fusarium graminearum]|uniref:Uncharacterized protein n=1 Tax=Gibberella zeae TaxID=5518 RepID=A0A4E9E6H9_GIBZA|nr:unnamed protein product [Fusarium graminearum]CAG1999569.1 unnamed protein product [Fusarium graminearum]